MEMTMLRCAARTLGIGAVAAGAVLVSAPVAGAQPPGPECPPQQVPSADQQQCQQQQPGLPNLPDGQNPNNSNPQQPQQAPPQNPQQAPPQNPQEGIDLSDKNCWVINGVPTMWTPGISRGPTDVVSWCPTTYGLQPH